MITPRGAHPMGAEVDGQRTGWSEPAVSDEQPMAMPTAPVIAPVIADPAAPIEPGIERTVPIALTALIEPIEPTEPGIERMVPIALTGLIELIEPGIRQTRLIGPIALTVTIGMIAPTETSGRTAVVANARHEPSPVAGQTTREGVGELRIRGRRPASSGRSVHWSRTSRVSWRRYSHPLSAPSRR